MWGILVAICFLCTFRLITSDIPAVVRDITYADAVKIAAVKSDSWTRQTEILRKLSARLPRENKPWARRTRSFHNKTRRLAVNEDELDTIWSGTEPDAFLDSLEDAYITSKAVYDAYLNGSSNVGEL
jgi:hypothetical protein